MQKTLPYSRRRDWSHPFTVATRLQIQRDEGPDRLTLSTSPGGGMQFLPGAAERPRMHQQPRGMRVAAVIAHHGPMAA